jgi:hypothetical protein
LRSLHRLLGTSPPKPHHLPLHQALSLQLHDRSLQTWQPTASHHASQLLRIGEVIGCCLQRGTASEAGVVSLSIPDGVDITGFLRQELLPRHEHGEMLYGGSTHTKSTFLSYTFLHEATSPLTSTDDDESSTSDQAAEDSTQTAEDASRPHRSRYPPKKYSNMD